jgi:ABC-type Zn uptake system ZnuABC Zn-binding protein ZnuA
MRRLLPALLLPALVLAACTSDDAAAPTPQPQAQPTAQSTTITVVTSVSPLRSIIENVAGDRARVIALVPEGTNAHTFEPAPAAVQDLAQADLIVINGLNLELAVLELAQANAAPGVEIVLLGDRVLSPDEYVFDFSFPESGGNPNPHLWTSPDLSIRYAEVVRDALAVVDPVAATYYTANLERYRVQLEALDAAIAEATATIARNDRRLLTYHDSFPFFGRRYGFEILGAIQPSDFSEPSPRDVASLVRQIRDAGVPAIFGSEVFPSEVLDVIANEAGAVQIRTLSDDDLPGAPGDSQNTLVAMMIANVRTMTTALGGDPTALDRVDVTDTWQPLASFEASLEAEFEEAP